MCYTKDHHQLVLLHIWELLHKLREEHLLCNPFHCPGHSEQIRQQTDFDKTSQWCQNNLTNSYQTSALPRTGTLAHHVTTRRENHVQTRGGDVEDCMNEGLGSETWAEPPGSSPPHGTKSFKSERTRPQCRYPLEWRHLRGKPSINSECNWEEN